ncbi:6-carboxyhexanoate--CoA ligase [Corynebacterium pygosceleis]|uniref:6-carboxyhexanoate--CoA ligase n=1 Tax=Corynebacterium pygosceleis TaxID=2800406 RepID=A0A9Q4C959_9CORY|nr:6-carboxyhexanoate--CoA ligase [Corynebacterium pygosceleis]MCK7636505.1 6-carboxyhexanoate--CoA ligase [Corynebacterium pygosceleis]MCK7675079.1 6-carboxyhexanoate--CoA ligase [Corynebacterium pygosceleis]MCL0121490.1 6-carboxyhexanoate--CoA ligase [Corynebacterium pygosceleis]MCX7469181.1 6-carboxyhexanoate--CoA ligase [Corynebacterium pygosceleis]
MTTYSVKMRASAAGRHISGAERIVTGGAVPDCVTALTRRALEHPKGEPDEVTVTVRAVDESRMEVLPVLATRNVDAGSPAEARAFIVDGLRRLGVRNPARIWELLTTVTGLRGAMLVDATTGERLEPDPARGVRVSNLDHASADTGSPGKLHYREAIALATKVTAHPHIIAEVCISDDPDYTTGYLACEGTYTRVPAMKEPGSPVGTRVFLYYGPASEVAACVDWLENRVVLVEGL